MSLNPRYSRRDMLRTLGLAVSGLLVACSAPTEPAKPIEAPKPAAPAQPAAAGASPTAVPVAVFPSVATVASTRKPNIRVC